METRILGPEYDEGLTVALQAALRQLGATLVSGSWGVGGSQEISAGDFDIRGERLHVESETYMGLSISGAAALVDKVVQLVEEQRLAADVGLALGE